jgi:hypothetical protein
MLDSLVGVPFAEGVADIGTVVAGLLVDGIVGSSS